MFYCSVLNQLLISQFASTIDAFLFLSLIDYKIKINLHFRYILVMIWHNRFQTQFVSYFVQAFREAFYQFSPITQWFLCYQYWISSCLRTTISSPVEHKTRCSSAGDAAEADTDHNQNGVAAALTALADDSSAGAEMDDKLSTLPKFRSRNYLVSQNVY